MGDINFSKQTLAKHREVLLKYGIDISLPRSQAIIDALEQLKKDKVNAFEMFKPRTEIKHSLKLVT